MLCIFDENELTADTKPEHILLNALGGRKTTKKAICSKCNNDFGGTIDGDFARQAEVIRNLLQLKSGTGNGPPMLRNVQAGAERINIASDGSPVRQNRPFEIKRDDAGNIVGVNIEASSPEELQRHIPNLAAMLKLPEDEVRKRIAASKATIVSQRPGVVPHELKFGGPEALRSVTKACLVLIAATLGSEVVRESAFAEARDFVVNGGETFVHDRIGFDSRSLPLDADLRDRFGAFFNLIFIRSNAEGRVIGHFTLLNAAAWQVILAETGGPPNVHLALVSNPEETSLWSDDVGQIGDIAMGWLETPDRSNAASQARIESILEHHVDRERPKAIDHILDQVMGRYAGADGKIPPERVDEFRRELADRVARHALSIPYERELTPEEMASLAGLAEKGS
ncbi:HNH endonuclease [Vitreimonas sp.]|uniref:HNH endonuclease n=1 Tax=Vitreimonas sp. TaxID=3069702 RepID=UPI002ED831E7